MERVAVITGGLRGLGRAMTLGLARAEHRVVAVGHIETDLADMHEALDQAGCRSFVRLEVADLRQSDACVRVVETALAQEGRIDILVNNAGLTFTTIVPDRARRSIQPPFWAIPDEIVEDVVKVNYLAADRLARRVSPLMVARGWGRIINVTTKLSTMNRRGSSPYGTTKAALEMATEIWAKDAEGTGLTVNILNPGAMADTDGLAAEIRERSRGGDGPRLVQPDDMVAPLLWLTSDAADHVNGRRFDAIDWTEGETGERRACRAGRLAGFVLHPSQT